MEVLYKLFASADTEEEVRGKKRNSAIKKERNKIDGLQKVGNCTGERKQNGGTVRKADNTARRTLNM